MFTIRIFPALLALILLTPAEAHHSVLNYDGKVEVKITGTVTSARFGYPHSIYRIDVENEDGDTEKWTLSTEDPRDAERLGFADELRNLKRGDTITVVGWPDKFKARTLRGHQLHYADGTVVMMRRGKLHLAERYPENGQDGFKPGDNSCRFSFDKPVTVSGRSGHRVDQGR